MFKTLGTGKCKGLSLKPAQNPKQMARRVLSRRLLNTHQAGGLEAGGLEAGGLEAATTDFGSGGPLIRLGV